MNGLTIDDFKEIVDVMRNKGDRVWVDEDNREVVKIMRKRPNGNEWVEINHADLEDVDVRRAIYEFYYEDDNEDIPSSCEGNECGYTDRNGNLFSGDGNDE